MARRVPGGRCLSPLQPAPRAREGRGLTMKPDDDDPPGSPAGGGSGRSGFLDRDPEKGGEEMLETQELKTVRLVCLFCREVRLIHVPIHCDTPKEVLWECLTCQERWASRK